MRHTGTLGAMSLVLALLRSRRAGAVERSERAGREAVAKEAQLAVHRRKVGAAAVADAGGKKKRGSFAPMDADAVAGAEAERAGAAARAEAAAADELVALIDGSVDSVFAGVFVARYRDGAPAVRTDALALFGEWLAACPQRLLTNAYLKYIGWMLFDGVSATVRAQALRTLTHLYALEDVDGDGGSAARLADFANRFRARYAEMVRDVDAGVSAEAVRLLRAALRAGHLTADEVTAVVRAVASEDVEVRRLAGAFLLEQLPPFAAAAAGADEDDDAAMQEDETAAGGASKGGGAKAAGARKAAKAAAAAARAEMRARHQLLALVAVGRELLGDDAEEREESGAAGGATACMEFVAAAFWGLRGASVMTNWGAYAALLRGGAGRSDGSAGSSGDAELVGIDPATGELTPLFARLLVRLLAASVSRASGVSSLANEAGGIAVPPTPGDAATAAVAAGPDADAEEGNRPSAAVEEEPGFSRTPAAVERSRLATSAALAPLLPDLLLRYGGDASTVVALSAIVVLQALQVYGVSRAAKAFTDLLFHTTRLLAMHTHDKPLAALAASLAHLTSEGHAKARDAETGAARLVASLSAKAVRLAAVVTGEAAGSAASAAMDEDDDAAGDKGVDGLDEAASAVALASTLRRLKALVDASPTLATLVDTGDGEPLALALHSVQRHGRTAIRATFAAAKQASRRRGGSGGGPAREALLTAHADAVVAAFALSTSIVTARVAAVAAAAAALPRDADRAPLTEKAAAVASARDALAVHTAACLALRHPDALDTTGGDDDVDMGGGVAGVGSSAASYSIPVNVMRGERAYVWRIRGAAFRAFAELAVVCAPHSLADSVLDALAWHVDSAGDGAVLLTPLSDFVDAAMRAKRTELAAIGAAELTPNTAGDEDDDDDDASPEAVARLDAARSIYVMQPLAHVCVAQVSPIVLALLSRHGSDGTIVAAYTKHALGSLRRAQPGALLASEVHAMTATAGELAAIAAAAEEALGNGDVNEREALALKASQLLAATATAARKHAATLGVAKLKGELAHELLTALRAGVTASLSSPPESLLSLAFLACLIPSLDAATALDLARHLDMTIRRAVGADDAQPLMNNANRWWHRRRKTDADSRVAMGHNGSEFGGYSMEQLRPWAVAVAFRSALIACSSLAPEGSVPPTIKEIAATLVSAAYTSMGLSDIDALDSAGRGAGAHRAPGTVTAVSTVAKPRGGHRRVRADDDEADNEADEQAQRDNVATAASKAAAPVRRSLLEAISSTAGAAGKVGASAASSMGGSAPSRRASSSRPSSGILSHDTQVMDDGSIPVVRQAVGR